MNERGQFDFTNIWLRVQLPLLAQRQLLVGIREDPQDLIIISQILLIHY
jgi:hypothetical protein